MVSLCHYQHLSKNYKECGFYSDLNPIMKIFVDADACPVVNNTIELAARETVEVIVVHNRHHEMVLDYDHVTTHETGDRSDAADHYIYNNLSDDDLVVTDDLGLAAMVLGRGAEVLRFRGDRPTRDDIEMRLSMREASRRERQKSNRVSGPSEYTQADRERFINELESILGEKNEN